MTLTFPPGSGEVVGCQVVQVLQQHQGFSSAELVQNRITCSNLRLLPILHVCYIVITIVGLEQITKKIITGEGLGLMFPFVLFCDC